MVTISVEYTTYRGGNRKISDITIGLMYRPITHISLQTNIKYRKYTLSISCIGAKWRIVGVFRELQWGVYGSNLFDMSDIETYLILYKLL